MTRPMTLPDIGPTLTRWQRERAALDRQPYMIVRSPDRDPTYHVARLGDESARLHRWPGGAALHVRSVGLTVSKGMQLLRTPTPEDAAALTAAEAAVREAQRALHALAHDAWYRGRPITLDELTAATAAVYGPER